MRARASALHSHEDLLRDQLEFLRDSHALSEHVPSHLDERYLAALSNATESETQSSALLPPIEERSVGKRSRARRRNQSASSRTPQQSFPTPFQVKPNTASVFAAASQHATNPSHPALRQEQQSHSGEAPSANPKRDSSNPTNGNHAAVTLKQEASSMLAAMSVQQIREAQQQIYSTLSPQSIAFLKKRRAKSSPVSNEPKPPLPPAVSPSLPPGGTDSIQKQQLSRGSAHTASPKSASLSDSFKRSPHNSNEHQQDADQFERAKSMWMTDATEPLQTQTVVDEVLSAAVEDMGPIATERFDLTGNVLTAEQIQSLPTHKGLHHHGTSPASAGYTLADLLVLTRSTVLSQRIVALRVLTALISLHAEHVTEPMLRSGGMKLVFAPLPAADTFHSAITNQVAYLEAVEALLQPVPSFEENMLVRDLYFSSDFYSSHIQQQPTSPLVQVLGQVHCVTVLLDIASALHTSISTLSFAKRSLNACRIIVLKASDLVLRVIKEQDSPPVSRILNTLMQLAVGKDKLSSSTTMLACDILALFISKSNWVEKDAISSFDERVLSENFLLDVAVHLNWALRDSPFQLRGLERETAKGVLRLFRSFLTRANGYSAISAYVQAICRLTYDVDGDVTVEAYLTLEAYVHCLTLNVLEDPNPSEDQKDFDNRKGNDKRKNEFAKDQIVGLIPQVLKAAKAVAGNGKSMSILHRAAAGHFVASALTLTPVPFDKSFYEQLKCVAAQSNREMSCMVITTAEDFRACQALASLSHSIARLLKWANNDSGFVKREVRHLLNVANKEKTFLDADATAVKGRVAANACAEWMGLNSLFKPICILLMMREASGLLACLNDAQVILDLLSRCILRKGCLLSVGGGITPTEAERIAKKLLPLTWTLLTKDDHFGLSAPKAIKDRVRDDKTVASIDALAYAWMLHDKASFESISACKILFQGGLLDRPLLFETVIEASVHASPHASLLFHFLFDVGQSCIDSGGYLIRPSSKTGMSSLSTSVDSNFSTSVLRLTDQLVSRGPPSLSSADGKNIDHLASVILTIMCGLEADFTLRGNMWKRCVEDCGGAALFMNAHFMYSIGKSNANIPLEQEEMMVKYMNAMGSGLLEHSRCPDTMIEIIYWRMYDFSQTCSGRLTLDNLLLSLSHATRIRATRTICQFSTSTSGNHCKSIMAWMQNHTW